MPTNPTIPEQEDRLPETIGKLAGLCYQLGKTDPPDAEVRMMHLENKAVAAIQAMILEALEQQKEAVLSHVQLAKSELTELEAQLEQLKGEQSHGL